MAEKFVKASSDDTVAHAARELYRRRFNIGSDWTRIRIGAFFSLTAATGTNDAAVSEIQANSTPADRIAFGISKYDAPGLLPGVAGQNFIGVTNHSSNNVQYRNGGGGDDIIFAGAATQTEGGVTIGTTRSTISSNVNSCRWQLPTAAQMTGTSTWARYFGMDIEIVDRGLATQAAKIYLMLAPPAATGAVTDADMRAQLSAAVPVATAFTTQNFHVGGVPVEIPDAFFLYVPFLNNLIRVHNYGVLRIA